jgi:DNA-directed RNA polymerase-5 subunit 1
MHNDHTVEINPLWCDSLSVDFNIRHPSTSTTIIMVKSEDLEFLVLRDNWLVTNRKVNLQLGNDSLVATKAMSYRAITNKKLIN